MPLGKSKIQLGESWVVEGEDSPDYSPSGGEESPLPKSTPRRPTRNNHRSPEPEFVMPPLDPDTLEASWAESTSRSARSKGVHYAEKETRRRASHQGANTRSPEKQSKLKKTKKINHEGSFPLESPGPQIPQAEPPSNLQQFVEVCLDHAKVMFSWAFEVLGGALRVLKTPISYILAVWLLFGLGVILRNLITNSIYASISPVCRIPGVSMLNLPFCPAHRVDTSYGDQPPVEFEQLVIAQSKFEEVLADTAGNVALPMEMKRGEASIRDLRQIVRYSQLHSK